MNTALLTIDDVPSCNTPALVDYLNEKGIRAILFATGTHLDRSFAEAQYALRHGMIIGNHSHSHPAFSSLTLDEAIGQIEACEERLNELYRSCGLPRLYRPFRFPYGDKGGANKAALQLYLREHGFHKVDDRHIPYPWWRENGLDRDIDTFWTFDFEEYRLQYDPTFTREAIWDKMHTQTPKSGDVLFRDGNRHIVLLHDHDQTEAIYPGYYRHFIDHLLENGITFDEPRFL